MMYCAEKRRKTTQGLQYAEKKISLCESHEDIVWNFRGKGKMESDCYTSLRESCHAQ